MHATRRQFLHTTAALAATSALASLGLAQESKSPPANAPKAPPKPPALPADQVREVVAQAHRSLDAVRQLVEATPLLANASWDWGGGDFETPLQAAAHTGGREIAEYLRSKQARFDLYAAAMLGELDLIKPLLAADPVRLAAVPGPHGFTLLHCARKGGDAARPVVEWLLAAGVPDVGHRPLPFVWPAGTAPSP